jgi:hypothetical protein
VKVRRTVLPPLGLTVALFIATSAAAATPEAASEASPSPPQAAPAPSPPPAARLTATEAAATMHYSQAMQAYKAMHFYDAARSFDAAHAALPRPVLLLNSGRAWEQAHDLFRALARFKALREDPEAPPQLRQRATAGYLRVMDALAAQSQAAMGESSLSVTVNAAAAAESAPEASLAWEWFGVRLLAGVFNLTEERDSFLLPSDDTGLLLSAELVFFTMLWDWGYWDILRIASGWPLVLTWGGSLGFRQQWGPHELRTGIHITNLILPLPVASGFEAIYLHEFESMSLEAGVRFNTYPPSLMSVLGLKF